MDSSSLVIASAGNNCICDDSEKDFHDVAYLNAADDMGHGGSFVTDEQVGGDKLYITGSTVLSSNPDKDTGWIEIFRYPE